MRGRLTSVTFGCWVVLTLVPASAQRTMAVPAFTLSANRPQIADRGKLHFHNPATVETGDIAGFENRATFGGIDAANNSRYLRLGVKTVAGRTYAIACAVKSKGAGEFEVVGPNHASKAPLSSTQLTFTHDAQLSHWSWFTIAASAPWTFESCTVTPKG